MLKIRLQGTVKDIRWFKRLLEKHPEIRCSRCRRYFPIKGRTDTSVLMRKWKRQKRKRKKGR